MAKISDDAMKATYQVAKQIRERAITWADGIEDLHKRFGMNRNSAGDAMTVLDYMLDGKTYKRTNNAFGTDHFLQMIWLDYGRDVLERAVSSVEQHVAYYERLGRGSLRQISRIAAKHRSFLDGQAKSEESPGSDTQLAADLTWIETQQGVSATTKEALVDARLGQGEFRLKVLRAWGNCCAVTGSTTHAAIRASHIKPWRSSSNAERLDPGNGLPLIANLDALFDGGLISFNYSGRLLVSDRINGIERDIFGLTQRSLRKRPTEKTAEYLSHHRAKHGFKD
jgi:HNH endonuclease